MGTPYDDVFRTMCIDLPRLIIPINNEGFGEDVKLDAKVMLLSDNIFITDSEGKQQKRIVDSIYDIDGKRYHWECESNPDKTMLLRLWEYDSQIAGQDYELSERNDVLTVSFPKTALLYLRSQPSTSDSMTIRIETAGGTVEYMIPVIKNQNYELEEIFEKNLYFLIPFYIFKYEPELKMRKKKKADEEAKLLSKLTKDVHMISDMLDRHVSVGKINEYEKKTLLTMARKCFESLTRKHKDIHEEVEKLMGGEILEYEAKTILRRGIAQGLNDAQTGNIKRMLGMGYTKKQISESLDVSYEMIDKVKSDMDGGKG